MTSRIRYVNASTAGLIGKLAAVRISYGPAPAAPNEAEDLDAMAEIGPRGAHGP